MGNHPTKLKAREMEHQGVPCAATPSLVGCWEGRWGWGGEVQRHPAAGPVGAALAAQGIPIHDRDMESCNVELIFDHVGHFGK